MEKDEIKNAIATRIAELNKADSDFFKDRWNMELPEFQRMMAREHSNMVTMARQELESILKLFNT